MKKLLFYPSIILIFVLNIVSVRAQNTEITLNYSPVLRSLADTWSAEYSKADPSVKMTLLSRDNSNEVSKGLGLVPEGDPVLQTDAWKMVIGRNAMVPLISPANPFLSEISAKGVTLPDLKTTGDKGEWNHLVNIDKKLPVHIYLLKDESIEGSFKRFFGSVADQVIIVNTAQELLSAVKKDPLALGFCSMTSIASVKDLTINKDYQILPVDKNANGKLDEFEKIYGSIPALIHGVWTGKFPKDLCQNIYFVASAQPADPATTGFLKWVLTKGQDFLNAEGYTDLGYNERNAKLALLEKDTALIAETKSTYSVVWIIILAVVIIAGMIITVALRRKPSGIAGESKKYFRAMNQSAIIIPKGLFFDKSHTWAFMEKDGMVRMGVDDFMPRITGPLTRVILKKPGDQVSKGERILTLVQDGKQLNILSPVTGIIRGFNSQLLYQPYLINDSPFNEGWVYLVEPSNWLRETSFLFMSEKYGDWLKNEFGRIRDFFASGAFFKEGEYTPVVLQDGGEIKENVLQEFGPEIWEEFQTNFIEKSF